MSTPLRLGLLQYGVVRLRDLDEYAQRFDALVAEGARHADLLLMPEYACMELAAALVGQLAAALVGQLAAALVGQTDNQPDANTELRAVCAQSQTILEIMRGSARRHGVWLQPGTIPFAKDGVVRNRAPLIAPDGRLAFQDKHVMTRFENEIWKVQSGRPPAVFETPWGLIGIAVCYDSEFPSLVRAQIRAGAWLILVPTCTDTLHGFNRVRLSARARALENQCFVAVAPTVGEAPWLATLDSNRGRAGVYGPVDHGFTADGIVCEGSLDEAGWLFAELDPTTIEAVRRDGAVRNHHDWPYAIPDCSIIIPELPA